LEEKPGSPFKYNYGLENIEEFKKLVLSTCVPFSLNRGLRTRDNFVQNLQKLKKEVTAWAMTRRQSNEKDLKMAKKELEELYSWVKEGGLVTSDKREQCKALEIKLYLVLLENEHTWRLKSRALWIEVGDHNSQFFQNISNHRKIFNSIWELEDSYGINKRGFDELAMLWVAHFNYLFVEVKL
jgi:hypothetical protein